MLGVSTGRDFVASIPIALPVKASILSRLRQKNRTVTYEPGQVLFYRGHLPYGVFILHEGKVDFRVGETDRHSMFQAGAGTMLGLSSLLADRPYPLTAVVLEKVRVSFAGKSQLLDWVKKGAAWLPPELKLLSGSSKRSRATH
jgi:CRP/FNR family transcriptional regulator